MHFHHYTLKHLARYLADTYQGYQIRACFSQNKNELILQVGRHFLRIGCQTPLSYIVPADDFSKARKNVVDLFPQLIGLSIQDIKVVPFERVMIIQLDQEYELVLKMYRIGANILVRKNGDVEDLFNKAFEEDFDYSETPGDFHADAIGALKNCVGDEKEVREMLSAISPIFEREFAQKVSKYIGEGMPGDQAFEAVLAEAEQPQYYIRKDANRIKFILFEPANKGHATVRINDIGLAVYLFLRTFNQYGAYRKQYNAINKEIGKPLAKLRKVCRSYQNNILKLEKERPSDELGHILMANLQAVPAYAKQVELHDFYNDQPVTIRLKANMSPQENAERYYELHKDRKKQLKHLNVLVKELEKKIATEESKSARFADVLPPEELSFTERGFSFDELKKLKQYLKAGPPIKRKDEPALPYREFEKDGYHIWVGKGAKQNDMLSFKFAGKDDIWLHARDTPGSHVVIKQKGKQGIPKPVLEYAAGLAAWFSKRKKEAWVPVIHTPRKYVRKRKGDPPGRVIVSREQVILVAPVKE